MEGFVDGLGCSPMDFTGKRLASPIRLKEIECLIFHPRPALALCLRVPGLNGPALRSTSHSSCRLDGFWFIYQPESVFCVQDGISFCVHFSINTLYLIFLEARSFGLAGQRLGMSPAIGFRY